MTERGDALASGVDSLTPSAGAMLRAAREKRGLHIAALAAAIKVPQRKLEALEADRYEELLDLTFTRALAQSVCRTLKVDVQPVLDRLPQAGESPKFAKVGYGLNAPFRERPGRDEPTDWRWLGKPVVWGTVLVLAAAAAVAWLPERLLARLWGGGAATPPAASAPAAAPMAPPPVAGAASVVESVPTVLLSSDGVTSTSLGAPAAALLMAASAPLATVSTGSALLGFKVSAESWIEVQDARGQTLLSRRVAAGEAFGVDGELPLRLTIGNASATQVSFRGQVVDLSANTVGNVARMQLN